MPPCGTAGVHQKQSEQKVVPVVFLLDVFWTFEDGGHHILRGRCLADLLCEDSLEQMHTLVMSLFFFFPIRA